MEYKTYEMLQVDKDYVSDMRKCSTYNDFIEVTENYRPYIIDKAPSPEEEDFISLSDTGSVILTFSDNGTFFSDDIYKYGDSLFMSTDLNERYEDYGAIVIEKDDLKNLIVEVQHNIINDYDRLLKFTSDDKEDVADYYNSIITRLSTELEYWKNDNALCFEPNRVVDRYFLSNANDTDRYYIWNLLNVYKNFDWDKYSLVFIK